MPTDESIARGLFFVVGTGRCGSTLLQAMLNAHPLLHVPPETHFFARLDPRRLTGRDGLRTARAADAYVRRAVRSPRWEDFGIDAGELRGAIERGARSADRILTWLIWRTSLDTGAERFGEKTPRHAFYLDRIRECFPDASIIHIHRDPRDVVHSMKRRSWSAGDSAYRSAARCRDVYERTSPERAPRGLLHVPYESLVRDPEAELRRVCGHLGEAYDPRMLHYNELGTSVYHPREESWKGLTRGPIDESRIGRYREGLSEKEVRTVEWVVGDHLERLGYERDGMGAELSALDRGVLRARRGLEILEGASGLRGRR